MHAQDIRVLFDKVEDPRVQGRCLHQLSDILFIALCTLLSGGEDFEDMVAFAEERLDWLKERLVLPHGIPSHDTFNRVLQNIVPEQLISVLEADGKALIDHLDGKLVILDGKKLRGASVRKSANAGLYVLNAWVSQSQLCIGQLKVGDKSNEITAIPTILDQLNLEGAIISIDAIGCQKEIAEKIVAQPADYILAVKGNQEDLLEEVSESFQFSSVEHLNEQWEYDHGRFEKRHCAVLPAADCLSPVLRKVWPSINTLVKIEATRIVDDVRSTKTRYYITSLADKSALTINQLIRSHWSIENQLHWHLDVTFGEDASRARRGYAAENLSLMRKVALHRITKDRSKLSKRKRRYKAAMNLEYLEKILHL